MSWWISAAAGAVVMAVLTYGGSWVSEARARRAVERHWAELDEIERVHREEERES